MEFDIGQEAFQPDPPGYNEGQNGAPFLKIGVGILRRDAGAYSFSKSYPVVELARTTVTWQQDRAHFVQTLTGNANGYSCHLEEDVVVKNDRLVLNYLLRNTGTKPLTTEQYLHNFVCFSGRPVGPNVRLSFPYDFTANPAVTPWQPAGRVRSIMIAAATVYARIANSIEFTDKATGVPKIWVYKPNGYVGPELCAVEHAETQQRVRARNVHSRGLRGDMDDRLPGLPGAVPPGHAGAGRREPVSAVPISSAWMASFRRIAQETGPSMSMICR